VEEEEGEVEEEEEVVVVVAKALPSRVGGRNGGAAAAGGAAARAAEVVEAQRLRGRARGSARGEARPRSWRSSACGEARGLGRAGKGGAGEQRLRGRAGARKGGKEARGAAPPGKRARGRAGKGVWVHGAPWAVTELLRYRCVACLASSTIGSLRATALGAYAWRAHAQLWSNACMHAPRRQLGRARGGTYYGGGVGGEWRGRQGWWGHAGRHGEGSKSTERHASTMACMCSAAWGSDPMHWVRYAHLRYTLL